MTPDTVAVQRGFASLLETRAAEEPDVLAAVFPDERLTCAELEARAVDMARRLFASGVRPRDRVGIMLPTGSATFVALLFGIAKLNAIAVSINARYKSDELGYVADHAGLRLLVADARYAEVVEAAGVQCPVVGPEDADFAERAAQATLADVTAASATVQASDAVLMLYTSGTTSRPKGCELGHGGLLGQAEGFATRLGLVETDRFWTPLPLFHIGGITVLIASLRARAVFVHVGFFDATAALDQLETERCTMAFPAFETIWNAVLHHPRFDDADLSALRSVTAIGIPERLRQMQRRLPHATLMSATGSTESGGFLCHGDPQDSLEVRMTTAGRPLPGMEVRIIDPESGEDVPPGVDGELLFRGVWRLLRYHNDPEGTAAAIDADGWFHSGDVVRADAEGRVAYVGRYKDMLKVGGENVAAAEIEDFLARHDAVDVVQVVGAPDSRYAEVPAAYVRLRAGAQATERELIDFCVGRISTFKVPRYVRFVDEWPLAGEKIVKGALRQRIAAELEAAGIDTAPKIVTPGSS